MQAFVVFAKNALTYSSVWVCVGESNKKLADAGVSASNRYWILQGSETLEGLPARVFWALTEQSDP